MCHQTQLQELRWRIVHAEYGEFCKDLEYGLEDLRSAPSSFLRGDAWAYLQLSPDEAKRNFRSRYYILNPLRAKMEWGEDPDACQRASEWSEAVLRGSAHLRFFTSDFLTRIKVNGAKRYCKLRESKSHDQALEAMTGVVGAEIDEGHLRMLAKVRLAPARTIRSHLFKRADEFQPLVYKESRHAVLNKDTLRYVGNFNGFDYKLRFIVDDRLSGGLTCELYISPTGEKTQDYIALGVAKPSWDIITPESLETDLTYLVKLIRVRLNAVL